MLIISPPFDASLSRFRLIDAIRASIIFAADAAAMLTLLLMIAADAFAFDADADYADALMMLDALVDAMMIFSLQRFSL